MLETIFSFFQWLIGVIIYYVMFVVDKVQHWLVDSGAGTKIFMGLGAVFFVWALFETIDGDNSLGR